MPDQWIPGLGAAALVMFCVFFPVIVYIVRRKWRLMEIRRDEVLRLVRMAAEEVERVEKETAEHGSMAGKSFSLNGGGGVVLPYCALCRNPTATRCSRCKAVRYCSGTCQISHWRLGHKYECHPPFINGQLNSSDSNEAYDEQPKVNENCFNVDGKIQLTDDGSFTDQSAFNKAAAQPMPSVMVDCKLDIAAKHLETAPAIHCEVRVDGENHFTTEETLIINPLLSSDVKMHGYASSNDNITSLSSGDKSLPDSSLDRHEDSAINAGRVNFQAFPHATMIADSLSSASSNNDITSLSSGDKFLSDNSSDRHENSAINADRVNFQAFPHASTIAGSLSSASLSSFPNLDVKDEIKNKLTAPQSMNSSSADKSGNAIINENARVLAPLGSKLNISGNSKTSEFFGQGKASIYYDVIEPQSFQHINLSDLNTKVIQVVKQSKTEQLKHPPILAKDRIASMGSRQPFLQNELFKAESGHPLNGSSVKFDSSLANDKDVKWTNLLSSFVSFPRRSQSGLGNEPGRCNYKMLSTYDNFIRLCSSDNMGTRPCGLINCGNSCYANAVLQCLAFTRPLAAFLLEGFHGRTCLKKGWCFTCDLETLLLKAKRGMTPVHPSGIVSHIRDIGSNFVNGGEEDAHEFLRYSIDALQSACLKESGTGFVGDLPEETTLIPLIFGGYLHSKIKCMKCQGKSERREQMMDLTIDIHGDIRTLEEGLARYTASEVLEGDNKYKCGRCNSYERAKKRLTIMEAPNVLTIALKRYQSGKYGKINRMVRFPEYLNLAPYMRGSDDNSPVYRLYAVVVHSGQSNATFSGHYVCYVKNTQGNWFKANDSEVQRVDIDKVLSQNAYMLLYSRCSPRAPSVVRKEIAKMCKLKEASGINDPTCGNHSGRKAADPSDERFRIPPMGDYSSDASSLFSCSDEGSSWSTDSAKESSASDDFADSGGINSPHRISPDFGRTAWRVPVSANSTSLGLKVDRDSQSIAEDGSQGRESFLCSMKHCRDLAEQQRSNGRANNCSGEANSGVFMRSGGRDRTPRVFN